MSYGNQSFAGTVQGQAIGALGGSFSSVEAREPSRVESLLSMSANLIDTTSGLLSRLESLDQRLFGADPRSEDKARAPEPIRAPIDELQHRLGLVHMLTQRCFDAVNRLDRL